MREVEGESPLVSISMSAVGLISNHYGSLSAGNRIIADFILSNPHDAALMTIEELAEATGVSKATGGRFAGKLGLSGHPELIRLLRAELKHAIQASDDVARLVRTDTVGTSRPWTQSLNEDVQQILQIEPVAGEWSFTKASQLLAEAKRVFFVGSGSSAYLAQYGAFALGGLRGGCDAVSGAGGWEAIQRKLLDANPSDVAVHLAFPRYSSDALKIAQQLRKNRVPLIAVTDGPNSPLASSAAVSFFTGRKAGWAFTGSATGAIAVIEALLRGAAAAIDPKESTRRAARLASNLTDSVTPLPESDANGARAGEH